ncbi:2-oxoglutarate dehydrogenase, E2 component, dihydrolipoamide succinyltransferase [Catenuloplanes indicus]|uniref:Dihydrolipoamide acetyltransferase component of pyruvate dehydrogenase complex n=1 Tax=Catenuloplanes indicus TaxID=137267 RepID=A0AAE4AWI2_9ACTN|nr:2-oxoglutarate dehydrogenase, E2 component, dihydrolipoamide succinyltransferase [Catenuloplanes indicus]MDQ0365985.1 2-oxoglutarate dehydrogenase E2 component (dihydrolipoamide succinyltransferase) [Catenuloplanes indicus]
MPVSVTMPRLGESVTEGTVTRWLKQVGDTVEADEPLLEVSTDKVDTEIPSPASGVLTSILVNEDETAEVGSELAVIGGEGDAPAAAPAPDAGQQDTDDAAVEARTEQSTSEDTPENLETPAPSSGSGASGGDAEGTVVTMPALGESVTEGTVTRWLKEVGDTVEVDEPLLEVSTDKVDTEIPSPAAGTLLEIKVQQDDTAEVGAALAVIGAAGGAAPKTEKAPEPGPAAPAQPAAESYATPSPAAEAPASTPAAAPKAEAPKQAEAPKVESKPAPAVSANGAVEEGEAAYVTPLVRKLAAEHNVNLGSLTGTGVGGRIRKQDVLDAAEKAKAAAATPAPAAAPAKSESGKAPAAKPAPSPLRGRTEKMTRTRATIAKRMVESLQISAQLTTVVEVDMTKVAKLRAQVKDAFQQRHGVKLSFMPFLALATVEALQQHPAVNSRIDQEAGTVTYFDAEHLAIAVDTPKGLIVPVIKDAGDLNLGGLAKRIADVAERTRNNKIGPDEISGGTFTLTNTGSRGALFDTPIINQPQVGILGTGAIVKRAVVVDDPELGEIIVPRSMMYLALSYDHRIVDGADAARFLTTMKERLEAGNFEGELGL